jgi:hypothetical protein
MKPRRLVSALCGVLLATWPRTAARSDELPSELVDALKPFPSHKLFIRYHGELVEHNTELAPRC